MRVLDTWRLSCQRCGCTAPILYPETDGAPAKMHDSDFSLSVRVEWLCIRCTHLDIKAGQLCLVPAMVFLTAEMLEEEQR